APTPSTCVQMAIRVASSDSLRSGAARASMSSHTANSAATTPTPASDVAPTANPTAAQKTPTGSTIRPNTRSARLSGPALPLSVTGPLLITARDGAVIVVHGRIEAGPFVSPVWATSRMATGTARPPARVVAACPGSWHQGGRAG